MFNKGQIHIILLVLLVVGFILYVNFSDRSLLKSILPSPPSKSTPAQGTKILAPPKQEEKPSGTLTPVASSPEVIDTTPPVRFNPQPKDKSVLLSDTRKIALGIETDEKAICKYSDVAGVHYDSMQGKFDQTNSAFHSVLITTLSEGGAYQYYIKCLDEKGNQNSDDFIISFKVQLPEDKTPPVLSNPSHQGDALPAGTKEAVISISTNEPASCRYSKSAGTSYNSMSDSFSYYDQTKQFHIKEITGLQDGRSYDFFVRCQDFKGNSNTGDIMISFSIAP